MENEQLYDFYYSQKQKKYIEQAQFQLNLEDDWGVKPTTKIIQGKEYTEAVLTGRPPTGSWDDMKLVATAPLPAHDS